jgi:hypothetical protein
MKPIEDKKIIILAYNLPQSIHIISVSLSRMKMCDVREFIIPRRMGTASTWNSNDYVGVLV